MADKSLVHFIVDMGSHMLHKSTKCPGNQFKHDLEYGLQYPIALSTNRILRKRKTEYASLMTVDDITTEANTELEAVALLYSFKQIFYSDLRDFKLEPVSREQDPNGDGVIRALFYSIDIMDKFVLKKKIKRNVVIVTNSRKEPELDEDYIAGLAEHIMRFEIDLTLIGVDFDEQDADQEHVALWRKLFRSLPTSCQILTGEEALHKIDNPPVRVVNPTPVFRGPFRIGADLNNESFDSRNDVSCISFETEAFKAVMASKNEYPMKTYGKAGEDIFQVEPSIDYTIRHYKEDPQKDPESDDNEEGEEDEENLDYETELIDKSKIKKSYKYGQNSVTLPEELERLMPLPKKQPHGIDLRGVVSSKHLPKAYLTGESLYLVPAKNSERDAYSMYALVDALSDLESYGIARYISREKSDPLMVVLIPCFVARDGSLKRKDVGSSKENVRCLLMCRLPFFEDLKIPVLPSLLKMSNDSSETQVQDLMDDLVQSWDITTPEDKKSVQAGKYYANVNHELPNRGSLQSIQNSRYNQAIRGIVSRSLIEEEDESLLGYSLKGPIPELSSQIKGQITVTDNTALEKLNQLSSLLHVKRVEKDEEATFRRGKRRNFNEDVEIEEKFDQWSLEELLARGGYD